MNLFVLDQGLGVTGWASLLDGNVTFGHQKFKAKEWWQRAKAFGVWLHTMIDAYNTLHEPDPKWTDESDYDLLVYENPNIRYHNAARTNFACELCIKLAGDDYNVKTQGVNPKVVRKVILGDGHGNAGKAEIVAWALAEGYELTLDPKNKTGFVDDEADALLQLKYAMENLTGEGT